MHRPPFPLAITRVLAALAWCLCGLAAAQSNPAYDPPPSYYSGTTGLSGAALKSSLHGIIRNHIVIPYTSTATDVWDALKVLDEDPANPNNVILVYNGVSRPKTDTNGDGNSGTSESWEREHCWPKSFGVLETGADTSDLFNLRACRRSVNASRGNRIYANTSATHPADPGIAPPNCPECRYDFGGGQGGLWTPRPSERGDLARALFYMAVRYDGADSGTVDLELGDSPATANGVFGVLTTLLEWSAADPVSEEERRRNHLIYTQFQRNRNPFIDHPEMVTATFGSVPTLPVLTLTITPSTLDEGASSTGQIGIPTAASGPLVVSLGKTGDTGNTSISIPASVTIPAGQTTVGFTLNALTDGMMDGDQSLTVTGQAGGYETAIASITVLDIDEVPGGGGTLITGPGFSTQNFDALPDSGTPTWTDNVTIPGWSAQRTGNGTTITSNTGSSSTGALYSYGTTTDRALGSLGSSNASAGSFAFGVSFKNDTGGPLTLTTLSYAGEQWRNGGGGNSQSITFSYQIGNSSVTSLTPGSDSGWTPVSALDFTSPVNTTGAGLLDGNAAANRSLRSANLNLQLAPGQWIAFRWRDIDHSGSDHGLAIDDFRLDWSLPAEPEPPVITSPLLASGQAGTAFSYTITADNNPTFFEAESLPDGLSVNGTTGVISGIPSESGVFDVSILAGNADGIGLATLTLTVDAAGMTFAEWSGGVPSSPELIQAYAIGGGAGPNVIGERPIVTMSGGFLILTAVVRVDDPGLTVTAEAATDLVFNPPATVTEATGTAQGVSQSGVPTGCERQEFRVATAGNARYFMRLRVNLTP